MYDDAKRMSVKEFRKLGFIQEINRRLLHPCGLALEIVIGENGSEKFGEIIDCREEPEGLYYDEEDLSKVKAQAVIDIFNSKLNHRREAFGHIIQPIPEKEDI